MHRKHVQSLIFASACSMGVMLFVQVAAGQGLIGVDTNGVGPSSVQFGSIVPIVTENGFISASICGVGTNSASAIIQVNKPVGATVRSAFMAAASTGFSGRMLANGHVGIDGIGVNWLLSTPSSISSWNHWADVTSIVKSKIDAAAPGLVNFTITEVSTFSIDGEVMVVIFDDPNETTRNTIILLFGAQAIGGDTFAIALAEPLDKSDPNLKMDLSLGISFGAQPGNQVSLIDVNGVRMTSSAGGQDDGVLANGALITVGGLGDTNANPSAFAHATSFRTDDELYNLLPFVSTGDTAVSIFTINPSNDDNIFFGALVLASTTAIVGEGIVLSPVFASNEVGTNHTVTATVQDDNGVPIVGRTVTFTVTFGPNAGATGMAVTDVNGQASFTYTGIGGAGVDEIQATFVDSAGNTSTSNIALKEWVITNVPPFCDAGGLYSASQCDNVPIAVPLSGTASCDDASTPAIMWTSVDGVTFDNPAVVNPIATAPGVGSFQACMTVTCASVDPSTCCSSIDVTRPATDSDGDGTIDCDDLCPLDPNKIAPGICDCGTPDTDTDGDGTADCNDLCPLDPNKTAPGICDCGVSDVDTDGDGTADCNDLCPLDPNKTAPGICDCGTPDTDTDGDGTADCNDLCPLDPNKTAPGICDCGVSDVDTDGDGTADCNDLCPADPNKIIPGQCDCGTLDTDTDSDGTADCNDLCPTDPNKIAPGICGCGVSDVDTDGDGVADCNDECPTDPNKVLAGQCGCNASDVDSDLDGVSDCNDLCPGVDDNVFGDCTGEIPTVSEWGLAILALMLLIASKLYFGRQSMPRAV